ncbi:hypothetical protein GCM10007392_45210 [Saccharospirillum salsuginis]|uniref:DUF2946 domain-containing protein n=1 Tax=Saccharospirillum salsuginis TaxID=418750 RepID=A0A918KR45_9GAMM|nr:hypothetical protein GCM10007392_45210 [Saccharospirillum salsuginis]
MTFTRRRLHNGLVLQVICWLCFFLVPAINAQGAVDGRWMRLCASAGVVVVAIESGESPAAEHPDETCPCIQYSPGLVELPIAIGSPGRAIPPSTAFRAAPPETSVSNYLARGPPIRPHVPHIA